MTTLVDDRLKVDSLVSPSIPTGGATAVIYLRVSTKEQAEKGGGDEGYSIPAQRDANMSKAEQLGATVVEEFVDAGESARKADRPALMRMIKYVAEHRVNYCIVHKVDRLARNRADDVTIHLALRDAGVMLVSASENIDETPSGMLLHGIMSSIAEFYSRNLATETIKGLTQKASQGGTIGAAPVGYENVGIRNEHGREERTVRIDAERGELVSWAFQVFASGLWTVAELQRELERRGLTTRPTPRRPARPLGKSSLRRMLRNTYYKGDITYKEVTYRGSHEPLVPREVWYQVQAVLDSHVSAADKTQVHDHYLKGTVYCGQCGSRLIICHARNRQGKVYPYFVCSGRHSGSTGCTRQAMLIEDVEHLIEDYYQSIQVSAQVREDVAGMLHAEFDRLMASETKELEQLTKQRDKLEAERFKLLQAHYADAVPLDMLKREQSRIGAAMETIDNHIAAHDNEYLEARENLEDSLGLLANISAIYQRCDDLNRRLCNQAFFTRVYIDEEGERRVHVDFQRPFDALCDPEVQGNALNWAAEAKKKGDVQTGPRMVPLVEGLNIAQVGWMTRLELATTWTTTRGSTS
ncbi:Recombinase [Propionibacterium freudenreichii]|nr:Recombinase [Propionibacterium freudenreichii]SCQ46441.1 Cassette chromosome recombinase B3 [Propionibacterium freudenreichii]SCQ52742.1 Cassette chromosome recombinase B3 [Propionibacterium freudenreichii]